MLLDFETTTTTLRALTENGFITAWNHRIDARSGGDIWIIDFLPGNKPRCVEWTQAQVERWLRNRHHADAILEALS